MSVNNDYTHSFESLGVQCYILERVQESVEKGGQKFATFNRGFVLGAGGGIK